MSEKHPCNPCIWSTWVEGSPTYIGDGRRRRFVALKQRPACTLDRMSGGETVMVRAVCAWRAPDIRALERQVEGIRHRAVPVRVGGEGEYRQYV